MRVSHEYTPVFDDPNLVSCAGLASVLTLADRAGLGDLVDEHVGHHCWPVRPGSPTWTSTTR